MMEEERWRRYSGERASASAGKGEDRGGGDRLIGVKAATHTYRIHPPEWIGSPYAAAVPTPSTRRLVCAVSRAPFSPFDIGFTM
jgi:hypothetical protein